MRVEKTAGALGCDRVCEHSRHLSAFPSPWQVGWEPVTLSLEPAQTDLLLVKRRGQVAPSAMSSPP